MIPSLIVAIVGILLFELGAWWLFRRKLEGLTFPASSDGSDLPLFTLQRLEIIAVLHTVGLLAVAIILIVFLW